MAIKLESGGKKELLFRGYRASVFQDEKISEDGCWQWFHSIMHAFNTTDNTLIMFKIANLMLNILLQQKIEANKQNSCRT